jgi:hypothetical protein
MEVLSRFLTVRVDEWDHQDPDLIDAYLELCSEGKKVLDEIVGYIIVYIQDEDLLTSKSFSDETHTNVHGRAQ